MSIIFHAKTGCGGYGDRLVGLITCYFISKVMNKEFYIKWESPNIDEFIYIKNKYITNEEYTEINLIDQNGNNLRKFFEEKKLEEIFINNNLKIFCNQNLVKHLYKNKNYPKLINYEEDMKEAYNKIYTEFLIPKEEIINISNSFNINFSKYNKIIGIHIRTGDLNMGVGGNHILFNKDSLEDIIMKISDYIKNNWEGNYAIFVTSDWENINEIFKKYIDKEIFYFDMNVIHIDMIKNTDNVNNGIKKLFVDHILLTLCDDTITHSVTNFGRTAAIISNGEKYGLGYGEFIKKIKIENLVSKV